MNGKTAVILLVLAVTIFAGCLEGPREKPAENGTANATLAPLPVCEAKILCPDGRKFQAEYLNPETGKCEKVKYSGLLPCFDEAHPTPDMNAGMILPGNASNRTGGYNESTARQTANQFMKFQSIVERCNNGTIYERSNSSVGGCENCFAFEYEFRCWDWSEGRSEGASKENRTFSATVFVDGEDEIMFDRIDEVKDYGPDGVMKCLSIGGMPVAGAGGEEKEYWCFFGDETVCKCKELLNGACVEGRCKRTCGAVGSRSEGWYDCSERLIKWEQCSK